MNINFNKFTKKVYAFNIIFFENMFQQTKNVEFFSHQIIKKCRICICSKNKKNDFEYDIVFNDKYYSIITKQRKNATNLTTEERKIYFRNLKIKSKKSSIDRLTFVSNIILLRIYNALYFKWHELNKIIHNLLMITIFNKHKVKTYLKSFQNIRYFFEWFYIQNAVYYIWSWFLSKTNKTNLLLSLIFRKHFINI